MASDRTQIIRTDAVVLRAMDYGETSRIVTLFTREQGKMGVMARGARAAKSRFGSTLEPMSWVQALIHYRPGRDLQTLSECSHMEHLAGIGRSLERIGVGVRMIELVGALMQDGQDNPLVLDQLVDALKLVDETSDRVQNVWPFFAMRLAGILGLSPAFRRSEVDGLAGQSAWLRLDRGSMERERPAGFQGIRASRQALRAFAVCTRASSEVVLRMSLTPAILTEVNALVESYIQYHVEDAFPHRTARVLGQIGA